ncbi:unnamed protein product [Mycena citricolor]|uniref:Cytochrome b5 heme-binding domain-containing protein n=1 Tax=Mycena citricolor TaxID=2018698 RepID=A0AAD2JUE1_9AGAR|nr:unnamed protein product [Mycena citricolor]
MSALKQYTYEEVSKHNKPGDLWVVIDAKVYDLSKFADLHPGGPSVLFAEGIAGKDSTEAFFGLHRLEVLHRPQYARFQIGAILGEEPTIKPLAPGELSKVPYAEATWLVSGFKSPYFTDRHRKFQTAVRKFCVEVLQPESESVEASGKKISQAVVDKEAEVNLIAMRLGPGKHLQGLRLMHDTVAPEEFDYFHELIINTETSRFGGRGFFDGNLAGAVIGLPPILNFGSPELKARIVPEVFSGKKYMALAISEAFAGSDVSGIQTTAVRDGDFWIVTGTKKWITNGVFADYFTTGCKTDTGFTVIVIPRDDSVGTKAIKTSYSSTAGTAFVTFDNARVPVSYTLGKIGDGMSVILTNFNHERWMITCMALASQRTVVEECLKWASQRMVFGKPLTSQAVIRGKLAAMISRVESAQSWLENITHQMNNMTYKQQSSLLAGQIGLLKAFVTRSGQEIAADATQIFGGRAITATGMGKYIENFRRNIAFDSILGGTEDVLADMGVRQALKKMPADARL